MSFSNDVEGGNTNKGSLAFPEEQAPTVAAADANAAGRRNKKKLIAAAICLLALVGLVVGLSVGLTNNKDNGGGTTTATAATDTDTSQLVETKAYIDSVCGGNNDSNNSECKEACEPVDCCNPFAENSCLATNTEKCMEYAKCHVVKELATNRENGAEAAPSNLVELCSKDDKSDCSDACEDVTCCYESDELEDSCLASQFLTCADYAPCQVLREEAAVQTPAPANLMELCTSKDDSSKQAACQDACDKASCCWNDDPSSNCLQTDMITCLTYAPCGMLALSLPNSVLDRVEDAQALREDCSIESVLTDAGYAKCEAHCEGASCCVDDDADKNCFEADPIGCMQHLPCTVLAMTGGTLEVADEDELQQVCNLQDIMSGGDEASSLDSCLDKCKDADCCMAEGEENCLANGNALACASYAPYCLPAMLLAESGLADILSGGDGNGFGFPGGFGDGGGEGTIGAPPEDLSTTCSMENVATDEGREACEKECEEVDCCTSTGDDNCFMANLVMCATWNLQGCFAVNSNFQTWLRNDMN